MQETMSFFYALIFGNQYLRNLNNLFYNDMRNRVAQVYIKHLATHPNDKLAFNAFARLAMVNNITRNSECLFGNNSLHDEISLYRGIVDN